MSTHAHGLSVGIPALPRSVAVFQTAAKRLDREEVKAAYRLRYYWRKICHFFGYCPKCGARVSFTRSGQPICNSCKQR